MGSELDLLGELPSGVSVAAEELFPDATPGKPSRRIRRRIKLLRNAEDVLRRCLEPGETIRYVAPGSQLIALQLLTLGWLMEYVNRTTLVLTDRRLLLIHTGASRIPELYANQVRLDRVSDAARTLFTLRLSTLEGPISFSGVSRFDKQQLVNLIATSSNATGGLEHLCPRCFRPTDALPIQCPSCGEATKDAARAGWLSLLFPGLGDWYLGHRGLAVFEILGATLLWLVTLLIVGASFAARETEGLVSTLPWLVAVVGAHVFDSLVTRNQANRGLYSMDGELPTGSHFSPEGELSHAAATGTVLAIGPDGGGVVARAGANKKKRGGIRSIIAIAALAVLMVGGFVYLSFQSFSSTPSEQELAYITTGADLEEWFFDMEVDPALATTTKERYLDGSYEIVHEYEGDDLYLLSGLSVSRTASDATNLMDTVVAGVKIGVALEDGVRLEQVPDFVEWGDDSAFYLFDNEYGHAGNLFVARTGIYVYTLQLVGLYFEERDNFMEFVSPQLDGILENPPPRRSR